MAKASFQFHATSGEIVNSLLLAWCSGKDYKAIARDGQKQLSEGVPFEKLHKLADPRWRTVYVQQTSFSHLDSSYLDFPARNPGCLVVQVGWRTQNGLLESIAGAVSDDADVIRPWQGAFRRARKALRRDVVLVNPLTGDRSPARHYCSDGALTLAREGVKLFNFSGVSYYITVE